MTLASLFCKHDWVSHKIAEKVVTYIPTDQILLKYYEEILICKKCGKIKTIKI